MYDLLNFRFQCSLHNVSGAIDVYLGVEELSGSQSE